MHFSHWGVGLSSQSSVSDIDRAAEIYSEQRYVNGLYQRLDQLRANSAQRLADALRATGGTPQERSQRDTSVSLYTEQVAQFGGVENGLCFGRLDYDNDDRQYIGRIGLFDESGDYEPLLVDWRAPAARPFYLATAASPEGVRRRRHLRTSGRHVVGVDDEVLDLATAGRGLARGADRRGGAAGGAAAPTGPAGCATSSRPSRPSRTRSSASALGGVLVVQGGPGTGKTAVALHRAAYLLYTHRRELASRGVLIVGPNPTFLRYIAQVLPSLAETGVLLCTLGDLYPGLSARRPESAAVGRGQGPAGDGRGAGRRGCRPAGGTGRGRCPLLVDQEPLWLDRAACERIREGGRRSGKLHNLARDTVETELVHALADQLAARIGTDPFAHDPLGGDDAPGEEQLLAAADLAELRRELRATRRYGRRWTSCGRC